ncbi:hypothetical protein LR002_01740, partial [Candidatus Gracilibacteria bacterium]|nr:hypothetical protein [Candidatus Gracilibacteria bacterium]
CIIIFYRCDYVLNFLENFGGKKFYLEKFFFLKNQEEKFLFVQEIFFQSKKFFCELKIKFFL